MSTSRLAVCAALIGTLIAVVAAPHRATAQGIGRDDRERVNSAMEGFVGLPREQERPKIVDLRPYLPTVGRQTMNDCAAWAFGYAARSYLEAIDQNWRPDRPERIFSPTFIYNQVNGGEDGGSQPLKVLDLLREQGAATLAAQPYLAKDFRTAPRPESFEEAKAFRILSYRTVKSGEEMRAALAQGDIIAVGVRTNPVFSSGRYGTYRVEHHEQGKKLRRPDQPHDFHAMVVCGYSDHRKAFLFMNSWGQDWADKGFAWVGYDVADQFNISGSTERLIDFAVVMRDQRQPVERRDGRYRVVEFDEVKILDRPRFVGVEADGTPRHDVLVSLAGPGKLMGSFEKVTWSISDTAGERKVEARAQAAEDYAVIVTTRERNAVVAAVAHNPDGRVITYRKRVVLPEAVDRRVTLDRIDSYYMSRPWQPQRIPLYRWTLVPRMSEQDWADLTRIEWRVKHDTWVQAMSKELAQSPRSLAVLPTQGQVEYEHKLPGAPQRDQKLLAYPSAISRAIPTGECVLHFRDGTSLAVALPEDDWADPADDGIRYIQTLRPVGDFAGQTWHYYEVAARYPEVWDRYWHEGWFRIQARHPDPFHNEPGHRTTGDAPAAFMHAGYAVASFEIDAMVRLLKDPAKANQSVRQGGVQQLLDGQALAATGGGSPVFQHVLIDGEELTIRWDDRYIGVRDGKPTWEVDLWLGRAGKDFNTPDHATWHVPGGELKATMLGKAQSLGLRVTATVHEPFEVGVDLEWNPAVADGRPKRLTRRIVPRSPRHNSLTFQVHEGLPGESIKQAKINEQLRPVIIAPRDLISRIVAVRYSWVDGAGERVAVTRTAPELETDGSGLTDVLLPRIGDDPVITATFMLQDGSALVKQAAPMTAPPYAVLPAVQVDAGLRDAGERDGRRRWQLTARLAGLPEYLAAVDRVKLTVIEPDGQTHAVEMASGVGAVTLDVDRGRFTAEIGFTEASGLTPIAVSGVFEAPEEIRIDGYELVRLTRDMIEPWIDPTAEDIWATARDRECHHLFHVRANLHDLGRIRKVVYRVTDTLKQTFEPDQAVSEHVVERRNDGLYEGFPFRLHQTYAGYEVTAVVHMVDGGTQQLGPVKIEAFDQ